MFNLFGNNKFKSYQQRKLDRINFESCVDSYIFKAWKLDGKISTKKLSSYDRYLLEFKHLDRDGKSIFGLWSNIVIYDENLDVVYDAQFKTFKALNSSRVNSKEQMLLELEYWLSLDWRVASE